MSDGKFHLRSIGFLLTAFLLIISGCTNPDRVVERRLTQAQESLEAGQTDEAIRIATQLHQTYPGRLDVVEFLAFTHARNNNPRQAADFFAEGHRLSPDRADFLLFAAQALEGAGELDEAAAHYRLYIVERFSDASGWQALAQIEERRGRHRDAIDAYLQLFRVRPTDATAVAIGDLFLRLNNIPQAHHWYRTALETRGDATPRAKSCGGGAKPGKNLSGSARNR
jgi:tetratricopeptide (TPR) repeat protein